MARKNSAKTQKTRTKPPRGVRRREATIKRWDRRGDIPLDDEDQFHESRDKILLEGEEHGADDDVDEDEVFALQGVSDEEEEIDEGQMNALGGGGDESDSEDDSSRQTPAKNLKKKEGKKGKTAPSDEEDAEDEEEEEEGWGRKASAYYSSNAADVDSDDDEALDMEEAEALRLQAKARDTLTEADFGLQDALETVDSGRTGLDTSDPFDEMAGTASTEPLFAVDDPKLLIRHLEKTRPETIALARDWEDIAYRLMETEQKLKTMEAENSDSMSLGMVHLHRQALLTYGTTLAFYLYMCADPKYAQKPELLRSHPILKRLLTLKQSLITLEDLDIDVSDDEDEEDLDALELELDGTGDSEQLWSALRKKGFDLDELRELLADAGPDVASEKPSKRSKLPDTTAETPSKKSKKKAAGPDQPPEPPNKKRKTANTSDTAPVVFDLVEPVFTPSKPPSQQGLERKLASNDAFGEATALEHADAADKKAHKKSLQFYTSKVESTTAKRQSARTAMGGDDDLPYRDRRKDKKVADKSKASLGQGGDDLDNNDPEPQAPQKRARDEETGAEEDDAAEDGGYYSLVKRKSKERKARKQAEYDEARTAARMTVEEGNDAAGEGPRSLTRAILKNKGLTPTRSKSVRNPRVKKRQRFEKAKRKVSSQRAVYKGGKQDAGRYEGERTGISKTVKSTRL